MNNDTDQSAEKTADATASKKMNDQKSTATISNDAFKGYKKTTVHGGDLPLAGKRT